MITHSGKDATEIVNITCKMAMQHSVHFERSVHELFTNRSQRKEVQQMLRLYHLHALQHT